MILILEIVYLRCLRYHKSWAESWHPIKEYDEKISGAWWKSIANCIYHCCVVDYNDKLDYKPSKYDCIST